MRCTAVALVALALAGGCRTGGEAEPALFERVSPDSSGVVFVNGLRETNEVNILSFEYLYNGGGVAVGDVTGDGRPDLFFTATQLPNRLYRNLGDFRFEDITEEAGVAGRDSSLSTGTTMADVDVDGDLDLYVCQTGKPEWGFDRRNLLYINDGAGRFTEEGAAYGLDFPGYSNQATFFDYDRDGDLDLYLLNHPPDLKQGNTIREWPIDPLSSDRLFRNDGGRFTDVSDAAGIRNHAFGLSATAFDYDGDGWTDVFIANDYVEPDYLYRNNGDGTFSEVGRSAFPHTTSSGMGADAADVNNDGELDLVVLDMMAEDARRQRLLASMMSYDRYHLVRANGRGDQVMRNMLQLNAGDGSFADVGQLAGVSTTDWSWGPLLADLDLDGFRDLFIANGFRRDITNLDYVQFAIDSLRQAGGGLRDIYQYLDIVPSEPVSNYAFRNRGDLTFEDVSAAWGVAEPSFSNGAAYGDLDGDGDLDLIVNDIDAPARIYRNRARELYPERHWLRVAFAGPPGNTFGLGAHVEVAADTLRLTAENTSTRGFYSSVEPTLHFGVGGASRATVTVRWPDGRTQRVDDVPVDQTLTLRYDEASDTPEAATSATPPIFGEVEGLGLDFEHAEDLFVDFKRDLILPRMYSRDGPALAAADVNGDGRDDLFVGGAAGQAGVLYLQGEDGTFGRQVGPWVADSAREDTRAAFFDADGDGAPDLYVASGGSHLVAADPAAGAAYQDRLYFGDGRGGFRAAPRGTLPAMPTPTGAVAPSDVDGDGDTDLFVGGRLVPGRYPEAPRSYLLINDGRGRFSDATAARAPGLDSVGLVTAAVWAEVDGVDGDELLVVGEWMAPSVWRRTTGGGLERLDDGALAGQEGWWTALLADDLDGDGDTDFVAGNLGLNSRFRASAEHPFRSYSSDFDGNGTYEAVLAMFYGDGRAYPVHRRETITRQMPYLQRRFPRYGRFSAATMDETFTEEERGGALLREVHTFASTWFENDGAGRFTPHVLPTTAQVAPIYAFAVSDFDRDGRSDLLVAGNSRAEETESGPYDALRGLILRRTERGWQGLTSSATGLRLTGDVRGLVRLRTPQGAVLVAGENGGRLRVYRPQPIPQREGRQPG